MADRDLYDDDGPPDPATIPNPLEQTFDKRFVQNPRGRMAGFRVAQLIPGIGPASATRLLDAMDQGAEPLAALQAFEPPGSAREEWGAFAALFANVAGAAWPADLELAKEIIHPDFVLHRIPPPRISDEMSGRDALLAWIEQTRALFGRPASDAHISRKSEGRAVAHDYPFR